MISVATTKKLERRYIEHVARELARVVDERFEGNQTRAAKALGISQPHLSHLIAGEGRGPGLNVLLRLRDYTDRSIDSLLGLPPVKSEELVERFQASLETEVARFRAQAKKTLEHAQTQLAIASDRKKAKKGRPKKEAG